MFKSEIKVEDILAIYETGPEAVTALINSLNSEHTKIVEHQTARITELEEKVKLLEEKLNKNSLNSSKPPSTDNDATKKLRTKSSRIKSGKNAGGQKGHKGTTLSMVENPDFRDFLLSSGLKNHREHRGHREKLHRSVLSEYSVVEKLCSNSLFQEKLKSL